MSVNRRAIVPVGGVALIRKAYAGPVVQVISVILRG
jgi:hypothetical protein